MMTLAVGDEGVIESLKEYVCFRRGFLTLANIACYLEGPVIVHEGNANVGKIIAGVGSSFPGFPETKVETDIGIRALECVQVQNGVQLPFACR